MGFTSGEKNMRSVRDRMTRPARLALIAAAAVVIHGTTHASNRLFLNSGTDANSKWENSGIWSTDGQVGVLPPPKNDATLFLYLGSGTADPLKSPATVKFDNDTMNFYLNTVDPAYHVDAGNPLNIGSIVVSNAFSSNGTFLFNAGTISIRQFYVGGWGANAGGGEDGGHGTVVLS